VGRIEELAEGLQRDRSTVYRAVQKLVAVHLAERQTVAMRGGGYYHVYRAVPPGVVRSRIEERMTMLQAVVRQSLAEFEQQVQRRVAEAQRRDGAHAPPLSE
jgi:predicted transcriptional regulator